VIKASVSTPQRNLRPTTRRGTVALSAIAPMPSSFHLSAASTDTIVEIEKWQRLIESYLQRVPRRKKA